LIENKKLVTVSKKKTVQSNIEEDMEDTIYECEKCGSKKIETHQVQTRGADEPMNSYFKCITCGFKWVEN